MALINSDIVEAYSLCPRKAFLLWKGEPEGVPHEYVRMIEEQAAANRQAYQTKAAGAAAAPAALGVADLMAGHNMFLDALVVADGLEARCDALKRTGESFGSTRHRYEPVKVVGTERVNKPQVIGLAYLGHVLGQVQQHPPVGGMVVLAGERPCRVKLADKYKEVRLIVAALKTWVREAAPKPPPVVLNRHCPCCPFRDACFQQAEREDNLSLLDRMTLKLMRKYHDKGIFTVRQLSHIYKPRRSRKKAKRQVRHSLELQALAIRTGKVHVEHLPALPRSPVTLYLDFEGVPDRDSYYLVGLLICKPEKAEYESIWADDATGEAAMWSALIERLAAFPDSPVYHYGSYEKKAFATLAKRHGSGGGFSDRLVNVASSVYGKVYFPVRSNGLKLLGRFLGASWTDPQASGLQSLVWRQRWEMTRDERFRQSLLQYNREDCEAVRLLVDHLEQIRRDAASDPMIEFASRPKRHATETGKAVHGQFERILQSAQVAFKGREIRIREGESTAGEHRKLGAPKGHQAYQRIIPAKAGRAVTLPSKRNCPRGHGRLATEDGQVVERTVIDLLFTRNGCRKTITRYKGRRNFCPICKLHYLPPSLDRHCKYQFGHAFQAWTVYQRIILRLPYRIIVQVIEHLFGVGMCASTGINFVRYLAGYYAPTEAAILEAIRKSDFVHVDETKINIQGVDHYVWVFTDGKYVVFRMTETREADIVREVLAGYQGVLVSDFFPGYDSMPCRKQKCLVHLIRDINDDLWKAPFDKELEAFAVEVQALLVPILVEVDRYGLKAWHLRKFLKSVERFYDKHIIGREYTSETVRIFQKRFDRYRGCLFTFLTQDGIPWENNMAERAIRQLAVQRKISGSFFKRVAPQYLLLLAISQTCRFQGKSFLKFLLSKGKDVDEFRRSRPIKYSTPVGVLPAEPSVAGSEGSQPPPS